MANKMLSYTEAAHYLGVPVGTLYSWVHHRALPHVRLGPRLVRFDEGELSAWLNHHRVPADGAAAGATHV